MGKYYANVTQVKFINQKLMQYIKEEKRLPEGAKIRYVWAHKDKTHLPHRRYAGQIEYSKILPNGNKQTRLVTAYGDGSIGMTTRVDSPSGELLKAYTGVRDRRWKAIIPETLEVTAENPGTIAYESGTKENVLKALGPNGKIFTSNPPADENNRTLLLRK